MDAYAVSRWVVTSQLKPPLQCTCKSPIKLGIGFEYHQMMNWHSVSSEEFLFKIESTTHCTQYHNARDSKPTESNGAVRWSLHSLGVKNNY